MENIDIILGCSFGDEGKGKVVYDLLKKNKYDLCVRFNGSGNAGHTVYENEIKYIVHQLPDAKNRKFRKSKLIQFS